MKSSRYVPVIALAGVAAATSIALIPRGQERALLLIHAGHVVAGTQLLENRIGHGDRSPAIIGALARSYTEMRQYQRAIELLNQYTALRSDDDEAYARLADLYKKTGDPARQADMLKRSIAIRPAIKPLTDLADLYHNEKQTDEELALLSRFRAELTVESGLAFRLAELLASIGDRAAATDVLMRPEVVSVGSQDASRAEARLLLAKLLIESGRSAEAVPLGKQWIVQWHKAWLAGRLLRTFAAEAPERDASEIAETVVASHPAILLYLVRVLQEMGAKPVARHLLAAWPEANPSPSMNEISAFLTACREEGEPGLVWQAFGHTLSISRSSDVIARYSEAVAAEFGIGALAPFWERLPQAVFERRPLLAAQLAFHEGDLEMSKRLLDNIELGSLSASDRQTWLDLLMAVMSPPEAFAVLRELRRSSALPSDLLARYARLAGELGQEVEYQASLADLPPKPR